MTHGTIQRQLLFHRTLSFSHPRASPLTLLIPRPAIESRPPFWNLNKPPSTTITFTTASSNMAPRGQPSTSLDEAQDLLKASNRILALCGAGLSAASGLPTFRGAGGLWRNHDATKLATPTAFKRDPALVWLFYAWRRHLALSAEPNDGHRALAELARKKENFLCLTQNVDREPVPSPHLGLFRARSLTCLPRSLSPCRSPRGQAPPAPRQPVRHQVLQQGVWLRREGQLRGSALSRSPASLCRE